MDDLIKLERMKLWRQAFVAHTSSRHAESSINKARSWANAAVDAFDEMFKQNVGQAEP